MNKFLITQLFCLAIVISSVSINAEGNDMEQLSGQYLGLTPPGIEPELFASGIISTDGAQHCFPAISPDGKEIYWMQIIFENKRPRGEIHYMEEIDGSWTKPEVAAFSGIYNDQAPVFSHNGNRLYFSSSRPGGFGQKTNIWFIEKIDSKCSEPQNLGSPPNTDVGATQPSFTLDGSVYFVGSYDSTQWKTAIYRSRYINGQYQKPELLDYPIRTEFADIYPYIAPDESFLIFGSTRPGGNSVESDLYLSFRDSSDNWSNPIHLDKSINNGKSVSFPFITHDGKYLLFNRFDDGTDKFHWVDAKIIQKYITMQDSANKKD